MKNVDATKIRELRERKGWTQEILARAAQVSPRTVHRAESDGIVSPDSLRKIANELQVEVSALVSAPTDQASQTDKAPKEPEQKTPEERIQDDLMGRMYAAWVENPTEFLRLNKTFREMGVFGLPGNPANHAWQYLLETRRVKPIAMAGLEGPLVGLTDLGLSEVERRRLAPPEVLDKSLANRRRIVEVLKLQGEKHLYKTRTEIIEAVGIAPKQFDAQYQILYRMGWVEGSLMSPRLSEVGRRKAGSA